MISRRSLVLLPLAALAAHAARAQPAARRYGAISVVGDQLTVVAYQPTTGSSIQRNERWPVPMKSTEIDDAALLAVRGGMPAESAPLFYRVPADSYVRWQRAVDGSSVELPAEVGAALAQDGVTHLVLVSKFRAQASVEVQDGRIGAGNLEGIGFYLDHGFERVDRESGLTGKGFIAPYVYVQLSLIDVAARRVVGRETVRSAKWTSAAASRTGRDPWEALTPDEKSRLIADILTREVGSAVGRLVAG